MIGVEFSSGQTVESAEVKSTRKNSICTATLSAMKKQKKKRN